MSRWVQIFDCVNISSGSSGKKEQNNQKTLIQNISYAVQEVKMNPLVTKTQYRFTILHNQYS